MDTEESILATLNQWHTFKFRPDDVSLVSAAEAARRGVGEEVFVAPAEGGKWIFRHKDTGKPAIFTFAVLWAYNGNLRTGNYVPPGEEVPKQTFLKTMKQEPSFMCDITYGFNVTIDTGIYKCIQAMEDCVQKKSNFNMTKKPRSDYQAAPDVTTTCYQIKHRLFTRCNPNEHPILSPKDHPDVHPWLLDASNNIRDKRLMLNLPLPSHLEYRGENKIAYLSDSLPPTFSKGDIVIITFRLGFYITSRNWAPEILPEEFIRVQKAHSQYEGAYTQMNWEKPDVQRRLAPGMLHVPVLEPIEESMEESQAKSEPVKEVIEDEAMSPVTSASPTSSPSTTSLESLKRNLSDASIRRRASLGLLEAQLSEAMDIEDGVLISSDMIPEESLNTATVRAGKNVKKKGRRG